MQHNFTHPGVAAACNNLYKCEPPASWALSRHGHVLIFGGTHVLSSRHSLYSLLWLVEEKCWKSSARIRIRGKWCHCWPRKSLVLFVSECSHLSPPFPFNVAVFFSHFFFFWHFIMLCVVFGDVLLESRPYVHITENADVMLNARGCWRCCNCTSIAINMCVYTLGTLWIFWLVFFFW